MASTLPPPVPLRSVDSPTLTAPFFLNVFLYTFWVPPPLQTGAGSLRHSLLFSFIQQIPLISDPSPVNAFIFPFPSRCFCSIFPIFPPGPSPVFDLPVPSLMRAAPSLFPLFRSLNAPFFLPHSIRVFQPPPFLSFWSQVIRSVPPVVACRLPRW